MARNSNHLYNPGSPARDEARKPVQIIKIKMSVPHIEEALRHGRNA
jgi:hypothetical protein